MLRSQPSFTIAPAIRSGRNLNVRHDNTWYCFLRTKSERAENRMRLKSFLSDVKDTACGPIERAAASIAELREMVQDQIASLGTGASMTAFYRRLETAEEEDLLSLLDDFKELKRQADEDHSSGDK